MDSEYPLDDKTILLDRKGLSPAQAPVTDFPSPARFEQLQERMSHAALAQSEHGFQMGPNSLVVASWALLSQVVRLRGSSGRESIGTVNDQLAAAVAEFEARALQCGVEGSQIISARYVLCSVIDEAVVTTAWGNRSDWSKMSLLSRFHNETFGGEKFFQLLERLSRDPIKHLAMLELMYLCLAIGFEGKYRVMEKGLSQLEAVRDALHRQIRQVRGDSPLEPEPPRRRVRKRFRTLSTTWVAVLSLICVLGMYAGFSWRLGEVRAKALQSFQFSASQLTQTPL